MLYLQNTTESQVLFVPKSSPGHDLVLVFKAKNTIDLTLEINQGVIDLETSDLYFNLAVTLPGDLPDGEYEYSLMNGDTILSTGLLVIGERDNQSEYDKEIQYEQYESE